MVLSKKTNLKTLRDKLAELTISKGLDSLELKGGAITENREKKSLSQTVKQIEKNVRGRKKKEKLIDGHMLLCA